MEINNSNTKGSLYVSDSVIEKVVSDAAVCVEGVEGIAASGQGLASILMSRSKRTGIGIELCGDVIQISAAVKLKADAPAFSTAEKVQEAIKSAVQNTLGLTVAKVDVNISDVSV